MDWWNLKGTNGFFLKFSNVENLEYVKFQVLEIWDLALTLNWHFVQNCRNPTLAKCGGEAQHLETVRIWSPPGLPNVQSSTARPKTPRIGGVLGVIGKVLKLRYQKCPRILDLEFCKLSYGQKKGRESNWQFDSWPLKVGNRPVPDVRFGSAIRRWKDLDEGYNFGSDLVAIRGQGEELW